MNRRRAPVARQKRRMHVDHAEPRDCEHTIGEDLSVGSDNAEIDAERVEGIDEGRICEPIGLQEADPGSESALFDRPCGRLVAAASRPIRLRHDADDVM